MTKITIVTDEQGNLIGAVQQPPRAQATAGIQASVNFAPGHRLHTVDVADLDMTKAADADALVAALKRYLPKTD